MEPRARSRIPTFREFIADARGGGTPGDCLPEQMHTPATVRRTVPLTSAPGSVDQRLPPLLTFQRRDIRMFADSRVVGRYREVRTGVEIVFPMVL